MSALGPSGPIVFLVYYSNIYNMLPETNAPELRVQTSLKRCGLKFSLRYGMSAKFPSGEQDLFKLQDYVSIMICCFLCCLEA